MSDAGTSSAPVLPALSWRLQGCVLVCASLCLWGSLSSQRILKPMDWNWLGSDGASHFIRQVEKAAAHLPEEVSDVGYLSDEGKTPGPWNDRTTRFSHFCLAQYALLPRVLHPSSDFEWVLARPEKTDAPPRYYESLGFRPMFQGTGRLTLLKYSLVYGEDAEARPSKPTSTVSLTPSKRPHRQKRTRKAP